MVGADSPILLLPLAFEVRSSPSPHGYLKVEDALDMGGHLFAACGLLMPCFRSNERVFIVVKQTGRRGQRRFQTQEATECKEGQRAGGGEVEVRGKQASEIRVVLPSRGAQEVQPGFLAPGQQALPASRPKVKDMWALSPANALVPNRQEPLRKCLPNR